MEQVEPARVINAIDTFNQGFRHIRHHIESLDDEELITLYEKAKEISTTSWLIRCLVLGEAKKRAVRGDGTVASLAKAFGIGKRMAEIDIKVYETFVEEDDEFEPILPAIFYQIASRAENPREAIEYAIEQRTAIPNYPASIFQKSVHGEVAKEKAPEGVYALVKVDESIKQLKEEADLEDEGHQELYGRCRLHSVKGRIYAEVH